MASGDTLVQFVPPAYEAPTINYATLDVRGTNVVWAFSDTTQQAIILKAVLPRHYSGSGITVSLTVSALAITGNIGWVIDIERQGDGQQDLDSDGFGTATTIAPVTVPGTSGLTDVIDVALTDIDGILAGETFRLRIRRDTAADNAVGNAELVSVELRET